MKSIVVLATMLTLGCSASAQTQPPAKVATEKAAPGKVAEERVAEPIPSPKAQPWQQARQEAQEVQPESDASQMAQSVAQAERGLVQARRALIDGKKVINDLELKNVYALALGDLNRGAATEKGTYAGISVSGVPAVLRDQLELPRGVGLVVEFVEPGSPAEAAGVRKNDVLQKLDEQVLIDMRQFQVLVRLHKPGEQIHLTLLRAAKSQTLEMKLEERDVAVIDDAGMSEQYVRANRMINTPNPLFTYRKPAGGIQWLGENGSFTISDDNGRHLVAKDKTGKVTFDGPIDTPDQMQKVPAEIRAMVKSIQPMAATQPTTAPARGGE